MALDQSARLGLVAQLKLTDVTDRIRYASAFIGAGPFERASDRSTHRNGTEPEC